MDKEQSTSRSKYLKKSTDVLKFVLATQLQSCMRMTPSELRVDLCLHDLNSPDAHAAGDYVVQDIPLTAAKFNCKR